MLLRFLAKLFAQPPKAAKPDPWPKPPPAPPSSERVFVDILRASTQQTSTSSVTTLTRASIDAPKSIVGKAYVVDGDTIVINKVSLRLAGIDAPELDHPYGKQAKYKMVELCKGQVVRADISPELSYDRLVATCYLPDGRDLSAELVRAGLALDWPKFSGGKYAHLELPDSRKKHWKAAARQRGHMAVFNKTLESRS